MVQPRLLGPVAAVALISTMTLLVSLGVAPADAQRLTLYTHAAGWLYSVDPHELLGIANAESTLGLDKRRSHAGACGVMGVLGSRYGSAPCWAMEAFVWLAVLEGAKRLAYFKRYCRGDCRCCYNRGWTELDDCGYSRKVRRFARRLK